MLNFSILMGRLTAAPEIKKTSGDKTFCTFAVAVERGYTNEAGERETDFINCVAWRGTADFISKYFGKGSMICVSGQLRQKKWTTEDGQNRSALEFVADKAYFTGERREKPDSGMEEPERQYSDQDAPPELPAAAQAFADKWGVQVEDGDLF